MWVGRMWGNSSYTTCGCMDCVWVLLGLHSSPTPPFFFQQSWCGDMNVSEGSKTVETKLTSLMYAHLGWLKLQNAHICPDEQASWTVLAGCRLKKVRCFPGRSGIQGERGGFSTETQLLKTGNDGVLPSCIWSDTIICFFQKWVRACGASIEGEHRFGTGMLLSTETRMRFWFPSFLCACLLVNIEPLAKLCNSKPVPKLFGICLFMSYVIYYTLIFYPEHNRNMS